MNKKVEFTATIRIQPSYYKKGMTSNLFLIDATADWSWIMGHYVFTIEKSSSYAIDVFSLSQKSILRFVSKYFIMPLNFSQRYKTGGIIEGVERSPEAFLIAFFTCLGTVVFHPSLKDRMWTMLGIGTHLQISRMMS